MMNQRIATGPERMKACTKNLNKRGKEREERARDREKEAESSELVERSLGWKRGRIVMGKGQGAAVFVTFVASVKCRNWGPQPAHE